MANASRTLVAESSCKYVVQRVLRTHTNPNHNISLASTDQKNYVLKPVSPAIWEQTQILRHDLRSSRFVRLPVDTIKSEDESILVYEYFTEDLLSFVKSREIPITQTKRILRDVLSGLKELHDNDWVHADVKSDNVVVEYRVQPNGEVDISRVNLADPGSAAKVKNGEHITGIQVGNVMWRSPEAQAGIGITKASDVFSFGIVCIHAVLRLHIFGFDREKLEEGVEPEVEVLERMISYFGPVPLGLLEHIDNDQWCLALMTLNRSFSKDKPRRPFALWVEEDFSNLDSSFKRFVGRMMNLDPAKRATVDELLEDPWWD